MVPQHRGTRILALAAALVVAYSSMHWSAAHAATGDPVLLNEMLLSHSGTDTAEFVELYGTPGTSLAGLALWSMIATIELTLRDGYGPIPVRAAFHSSQEGSAAPNWFVQG